MIEAQHVTMRGAAGELRWGYHKAADLGAWTVEAGMLTAEIVARDAFRISQAPLVFVVVRPGGHRWDWALDAVAIAGTQLTAHLKEG